MPSTGSTVAPNQANLYQTPFPFWSALSLGRSSPSPQSQPDIPSLPGADVPGMSEIAPNIPRAPKPSKAPKTPKPTTPSMSEGGSQGGTPKPPGLQGKPGQGIGKVAGVILGTLLSAG